MSNINNYTLKKCVDFKYYKMILKIFFTWWNRQTYWNSFKNFIFGKLVGKDKLEISTIKAKKIKDG